MSKERSERKDKNEKDIVLQEIIWLAWRERRKRRMRCYLFLWPRHTLSMVNFLHLMPHTHTHTRTDVYSFFELLMLIEYLLFLAVVISFDVRIELLQAFSSSSYPRVTMQSHRYVYIGKEQVDLCACACVFFESSLLSNIAWPAGHHGSYLPWACSEQVHQGIMIIENSHKWRWWAGIDEEKKKNFIHSLFSGSVTSPDRYGEVIRISVHHSDPSGSIGCLCVCVFIFMSEAQSSCKVN